MVPHYGQYKQEQRKRIWEILTNLYKPNDYQSVLILVGHTSQEIKYLRYLGFDQRALVCVDKTRKYISRAKRSAPGAFWWPNQVNTIPSKIIKGIRLAHLDFCSNICESVLFTIQYLTEHAFSRGGALAVNILAGRDHNTCGDETRQYVIGRAIRKPFQEIDCNKYISDSGSPFLSVIYKLEKERHQAE